MTFRIVQGDTAPPISSKLSDEDGYVDLSNASNIRFHMEDRFQRIQLEDDLTGRVNILNESLGKVEYVWRARDTLDVGTYKAEWEVLYDDGTIETFPTDGYIDIEITEQISTGASSE